MYKCSDDSKNTTVNILDALYRMTAEYKLMQSYSYKKYNLTNIIKRIGKMLMLHKAICRKNMDVFLPDAHYERPASEGYFSDYRIAVYTAIFGPYDTIQEPLFKPDNVDYFIITDAEITKESLWHKIDSCKIIPDDITDNAMKNRYVKMLPHKIFQDYEYSVYIDGNVRLTSDATILTCTLENFPVAMHRHKQRDCVYEEIEACLIKRKDTEKRLLRHCNLLKNHQLPEHFGLLEATVIARRHNDSVCINLMENWWNEYKSTSRRDQISLIDCVWSMDLAVDAIATLGNNVYDNHHFIIVKHK